MSNDRLTQFRQRRDHFFGHDEQSPLSDKTRASFTALDYYPENPDLTLTLPLETNETDVGEPINLATSDGAAKPFTRAGRITLPVEGKEVTLTVFRDVERGHYFLPFRDGTAGKTTYPVGRYLDVRARPDGQLIIDFNYAYNPYCAYSDGYSCPIPPQENVIGASIEAGERNFPAADQPADNDQAGERGSATEN
ncbi:MAG: DUF1684 domain-containing protein [Chloroflexota bacterium]|nr:DUF1684 domain-containing protein [Chloroflexota bacterium]